MKKLKIIHKLLIINIFIFIFVFLSQFVFQNVFFDKYYNYYKETKLKNSIKKFEEVLYNDNLSNQYINKTLDEDEIIISYLDKDLNVIKGDLTDSFHLSIKTKNNEIKDLAIQSMSLEGNGLSVGDFVEIDAFKLKKEDKIHIKNLIVKKRGEKNDNSVINMSDYKFDFEGEILSFSSVSQKTLNHRQAISIYLSLLDKNKIKEGNEVFTDFNQTYLISLKKEGHKYILASTSIEGSKEAIRILNDFNLYIIFLALILAIGIIYIYSKQITKPLLQMKEIAKSIANQDFDKKVCINSKDELQDLGESLNDISSNLKSNINELKEVNNKLKQEYEERLEMEKNQNFLLINISHDLKTPLTIIKGYLKAIKDRVYSKDEYIDYTIHEVDEISRTLNEMLEITKLKSKSYSLDLEMTDFTRLVYKTYDKLKYLAKEKQQSVKFSLVDDVFINIDEKEMKKALENLITNAIKYSSNSMNVNMDLVEEHDQYVFSIENEGAHIPDEDLKNIFKEFYRVDKSRNKKTGGNGLGLVIVKVILEAHHIQYGIKNNKKGVKFTMYLPKN
ncbi:sensor histidine kinase [Bacillus thuringiensis]|uniref:histidine kinase n=1 Tax=Bacillus thuringiensis serovar andalousiensis TaxID=257985 RepID=A0A6H0TNK1_BACTU|nr:HAMP domain-containing sensor histidine kinase [Bacillus thuringiensis]QIW22037.1 HAMP domain-containing histidine kinase [Bacillus thuringiensis serovar andalousiensis]